MGFAGYYNHMCIKEAKSWGKLGMVKVIKKGMLVSMVPEYSFVCFSLSTNPLSFPSGYGSRLSADPQLPSFFIVNTVATVTLFTEGGPVAAFFQILPGSPSQVNYSITGLSSLATLHRPPLLATLGFLTAPGLSEFCLWEEFSMC